MLNAEVGPITGNSWELATSFFYDSHGKTLLEMIVKGRNVYGKPG